MGFPAEVVASVRQARLLLSIMRTPSLRTGLVEILEGVSGKGPGPADSPLKQPFAQLAWLAGPPEGSAQVLGRQIADLEWLLGDQVIVDAPKLRSLPEGLAARKALVRRVFERVFEGLPAGRERMGEPELNARLSMLVEDVAAIRRAGIDWGIAARDSRTQLYWLL